MWQTVDYKGNIVKWYEAELIDKIKKICKSAGEFEYKNDFMLGMHAMAKDVIDLIQENER